jgi:hypothetical protein
MKGALHLAVLLAAIAGGILAASAAPRSVLLPAASLPPGDVSRVEASLPAAGPSGAPAVASVPDGKSVRRPAVSVGPGTRLPRPTARPTLPSVAPRIAKATPQIDKSRLSAHPTATDSPQIAASLTGTASWYGTGGPGFYAAMHGFVDGSRVQVAVCAFPGGQATCITVPVVTQCGACRWARGAVLVDLSIPAFRALGVPLSVGLVKVTVEVLR